ncbi:hypothetical protein AB6A40_005086 [Gnathostoma spinigerum]|uniref:Uncharacterized protein n=1 Tax=Gnathostoma spinigerum TaxID=75299 RepID=A0ABD6ENX3_9BILA
MKMEVIKITLTMIILVVFVPEANLRRIRRRKTVARREIWTSTFKEECISEALLQALCEKSSAQLYGHPDMRYFVNYNEIAGSVQLLLDNCRILDKYAERVPHGTSTTKEASSNFQNQCRRLNPLDTLKILAYRIYNENFLALMRIVLKKSEFEEELQRYKIDVETCIRLVSLCGISISPSKSMLEHHLLQEEELIHCLHTISNFSAKLEAAEICGSLKIDEMPRKLMDVHQSRMDDKLKLMAVAGYTGRLSSVVGPTHAASSPLPSYRG